MTDRLAGGSRDQYYRDILHTWQLNISASWLIQNCKISKVFPGEVSRGGGEGGKVEDWDWLYIGHINVLGGNLVDTIACQAAGTALLSPGTLSQSDWEVGPEGHSSPDILQRRRRRSDHQDQEDCTWDPVTCHHLPSPGPSPRTPSCVKLQMTERTDVGWCWPGEGGADRLEESLWWMIDDGWLELVVHCTSTSTTNITTYNGHPPTTPQSPVQRPQGS